MRIFRPVLARQIFASILVSFIAVLPVIAVDGGYPYAAYAGPGTSAPQYVWTDKQGNRYSPYGYVYRNCTDYVAWKVVSLGLKTATITGLGNAGNWAATAKKRGLTVDDKPAVWAIAVESNNSYGHVAFVENVYKDGTITVSEYNVTPGTYGQRTGTPAKLGFTSFIHVSLAPPKSTAVQVRKTTGPDGAQQVYTATKNDVYEDWWKPGGDGVRSSKLFTSDNIKDASKLTLPDGTQSLYTAVSDGVWESWWRPGSGLHHTKIIALADVQKVLASFEADNTHKLYVLAADGPYEFWWRDGGDGIHKQRLVHINNPVGFVAATGPDGEKQVYTATAGAVFESWWHPGQGVHTSPLISIAQNDITALDKAMQTDGTQYLYTSTKNNVWESWWHPAHGSGYGMLLSASNIKAVQYHGRIDGSSLLYVATGSGIREYSWRPWQPLKSGQLIGVSDISAFDCVAWGTAGQLYTVAGTTLFETWWGDGGLHTAKLQGF